MNDLSLLKGDEATLQRCLEILCTLYFQDLVLQKCQDSPIDGLIPAVVLNLEVSGYLTEVPFV